MKAQSVWILYGGTSSERDVSLVTGREIEKALAPNFDVKLVEFQTGKELLTLDWKAAPDIVFLGLHGAYGEDGRIQGFLECLEIAYVGSNTFSSALCFDKIATKKHFIQNGQPTPLFHALEKDLISSESEWRHYLHNNPHLYSKNSFIKSSRQGSSIGTYPYRSTGEKEKDVLNFTQKVNQAFQFDNQVIVEDWIEGRELTCTIFKGEALPLVEIKALKDFYNYENKYTKGKTDYLVPAPIDEKITQRIQRASEEIFYQFQCSDYARLDLILDKEDNFHFLEINTLPGMTPTSLVPKSAQAAGLSFEKFLYELVNYSWERQTKK